MSVLSFPKFSKHKTIAKIQDWSQQDLADFYRAHRLLVENGAGIGLDRGVTDIGEPWMVFYDDLTQDVFMHVARIDGQCILVCDQLGIRLKATQISNLITDFENAVRHHLSVRTERSTNIVVHPAARIIMSISIVFLLFKLDNSKLQAKDLMAREHAPSDPSANRLNDVTITATQRAHNAFLRLFEASESPANAAMIAGIILATQIPSAVSKPLSDTVHIPEIAHERVVLNEKAPDLLADKSATPKDPAHKTIDLKIAETVPNSTVAKFTNAESHSNLVKQVLDLKEVSKAISIQEAHSNVTVVNNIDRQLSLGMDIQPVIKNDTGVSAVNNNKHQAAQIIDTVLGWNFAEGKSISDAKIVDFVEVLATTGENHIDGISLDNISDIKDHVGFFINTDLIGDQLIYVLQYFIRSFEQYDIEYMNGRVLIEQSVTATLDDHDIGLWTNVLNDGSSISVVGQADLIDNIPAILL